MLYLQNLPCCWLCLPIQIDLTTHLQMVARKYDALAKEVAVEVANRATKQNLGNIQVRGMLMKAITDLHDKAHPTAPPIIIC